MTTKLHTAAIAAAKLADARDAATPRLAPHLYTLRPELFAARALAVLGIKRPVAAAFGEALVERGHGLRALHDALAELGKHWTGQGIFEPPATLELFGAMPIYGDAAVLGQAGALGFGPAAVVAFSVLQAVERPPLSEGLADDTERALREFGQLEKELSDAVEAVAGALTIKDLEVCGLSNADHARGFCRVLVKPWGVLMLQGWPGHVIDAQRQRRARARRKTEDQIERQPEAA